PCSYRLDSYDERMPASAPPQIPVRRAFTIRMVASGAMTCPSESLPSSGCATFRRAEPHNPERLRTGCPLTEPRASQLTWRRPVQEIPFWVRVAWGKQMGANGQQMGMAETTDLLFQTRICSANGWQMICKWR